MLKLNESKTQSSEFHVAQRKDNSGYACLTGFGRTIGSTLDILQATRYSSPANIMSSLGGHYKMFLPIRVKLQQIIVAEEIAEYPNEEEILRMIWE